MPPVNRRAIRNGLIVIIFSGLLFAGTVWVALSSAPYSLAHNFVLERLGKTSRVTFAVWRGFDFVESDANGHADFPFRANFPTHAILINVHVIKRSDAWKVTAAEIKMPDGTWKALQVEPPP